MFEEHQTQVNETQKNHNDHVEKEKAIIQQLKNEIDTMQRDNEETMK